MIRINKIPETNADIRRYTIEKIHIETSIYTRCTTVFLKHLYELCNDKLGFSKAVKGLFNLQKAFADINFAFLVYMSPEVTEGLQSLIFQNNTNFDKIEKFVNEERKYKINFKVKELIQFQPLIEAETKKIRFNSISGKKSHTKLTITHYKLIEKFHVILIKTLNQLNLIITQMKYNKTQNRRLFLAIDRVSKWYTMSQELFQKSSKKCDKNRKIIRLILMARKRPDNILSSLPIEIARIICEYLWF